jgi:predicted dehydrogenase
MTLKIGIAGLKRGVGFAHLFADRKDCRVVAVCDLNRARAEKTAAEFGAKPFSDYDRFCDEILDAVIIVTPPPTHVECAIKAIDSGKHVLSEVPAVWTLEEAERLAAKVAQTDLKYMIAENACYFPCTQEMHRIVKEGKIGQIILAEGEYVHDGRYTNRDDGLDNELDKMPGWRTRINPIQYCTHELGPLLMMMNDRIISAVCVESKIPTETPPGIIRTQMAVFKTTRGQTIRELTTFRIAREPGHHFYCLYGTKGSIETDRYRWMDNLKLYTETVPDQKTLTDMTTSLIHSSAPPEALKGGHGASEYYMVGDFVQAILEDKQPPLDIGKALDMTVPGLCAAMSAQKNGELVPVPSFYPKVK